MCLLEQPEKMRFKKMNEINNYLSILSWHAVSKGIYKKDTHSIVIKASEMIIREKAEIY